MSHVKAWLRSNCRFALLDWILGNCRFAKVNRSEYKRYVLSDPSVLGVASPYVIIPQPVERQGNMYLLRFLDPTTMSSGSKMFHDVNEVSRLMGSATPYSGELVGEDLREQQGEQTKKVKREEGERRKLMPPTGRIVSKDVGAAQAAIPQDSQALSALSPLAGQRVMVKGLPGGNYEVTTPQGPLTISESLFKQVMLAPEIGRENAGQIEKKFNQNFGTTERMKSILPSQFPNLAKYVQKGLVKILDSSKIFANYREGIGAEETGEPMGEAYFKNDVKLYGGNPDEFIREFIVDWRTPNKRFNEKSGKEELLRGYYSPQVLFLPDRQWASQLKTTDPQGAEIAAEYGNIPPEVLDEAERIATRSQGYKPYRDGGVYFNSTDLFRYVLGLSSGSARDLMQPSSLPGGSYARGKTYKPKGGMAAG